MTRTLGQIFIVAAPSGGGKTSLVKALIQALPEIAGSISHTTRDQRTGEAQGKHYFFISEAVFLRMAAAGEFIEHARVFDHYYGTSVAQLQARLEAGIDVVLDIDWQGAAQIRQRFPDAVSIFILPPSLEVLRQRLCQRGRDEPVIIEDRMARAQSEMQHFQEFDYVIINDDFNTALHTLTAIVVAARARTPLQCLRHPDIMTFQPSNAKDLL